MIFDKEKHTITLNKDEVTALLNCLGKFKNVLYEPQKPIEEILKWDDFETAKWWYNKLMNG